MGKNSVGMVILLSVLLFGQCKEKKGNEIQETRVIRVDMDREPIEIQKTGLIRDYRLIQLDTPEEALIGEIDQVIVFGQYIYIADYSKSKAVFIFDTTGHFLNKIDRYGRAGDEYMQLRSLWVDTLRRTLNFISRVDKKWFIYDPEGGKLLEVRNLPKAFMQVVCDGTVRFGYSGNYREDASQPYNVWCLDSLGGVERGFFEIPAGWESSLVGSGNALSLYKGQTDYVIPMDFHIYRIAGENLTCPWYFDFGAYRWPSPDVTREQRQEILRNGQEYVDRICEFQETDRFLLATVIFKGQTRIIVHDKIKDKTEIGQLATWTEMYFMPFGYMATLSAQQLITFIPAAQIKRCCEGDEYNDFEKDYPEQVKRMKALFPVIHEEDNPFIAIYVLN